MNNIYKDQLLASVELVGKHPYFTKELVRTQALLFSASGKIEESDALEVLSLMAEPVIEEVVEEMPIVE